MLQQVFGFSRLPLSYDALAPILEGLPPRFERLVPTLRGLAANSLRSVLGLEKAVQLLEKTARQLGPLSWRPGAMVPQPPRLPSRPSPSFLPSLASPPSLRFAPWARSRGSRARPHTAWRIPWPTLSRKNPSPFRSTEYASRSVRPCNDATLAAPRTRAPLRNTQKT